MFSSSKSSQDNNNLKSSKIDTIIGPSTKFEGNINASGTIRLDGNLKGDIISETDVIIGESGNCNGNITASNVTISGNITGNIKCKELLEILPGGKLFGDIEAGKISINTGAIFRGKCAMNSSENEMPASGNTDYNANTEEEGKE